VIKRLRRAVKVFFAKLFERPSRCYGCGEEGPTVLGRVYDYDGYDYYPVQAMLCVDCDRVTREKGPDA